MGVKVASQRTNIWSVISSDDDLIGMDSGHSVENWYKLISVVSFVTFDLIGGYRCG
jgi:hypothetical protein